MNNLQLSSRKSANQFRKMPSTSIALDVFRPKSTKIACFIPGQLEVSDFVTFVPKTKSRAFPISQPFESTLYTKGFSKEHVLLTLVHYNNIHLERMLCKAQVFTESKKLSYTYSNRLYTAFVVQVHVSRFSFFVMMYMMYN